MPFPRRSIQFQSHPATASAGHCYDGISRPVIAFLTTDSRPASRRPGLSLKRASYAPPGLLFTSFLKDFVCLSRPFRFCFTGEGYTLLSHSTWNFPLSWKTSTRRTFIVLSFPRINGASDASLLTSPLRGLFYIIVRVISRRIQLFRRRWKYFTYTRNVCVHILLVKAANISRRGDRARYIEIKQEIQY